MKLKIQRQKLNNLIGNLTYQHFCNSYLCTFWGQNIITFLLYCILNYLFGDFTKPLWFTMRRKKQCTPAAVLQPYKALNHFASSEVLLLFGHVWNTGVRAAHWNIVVPCKQHYNNDQIVWFIVAVVLIVLVAR